MAAGHHPGDPRAADRDHHRRPRRSGPCPNALREAGFGVGATRWEVIRSPRAARTPPRASSPALCSSLARALGEAAPLILVGAVTGPPGRRARRCSTSASSRSGSPPCPIVITEWTKNPQEGFDEIAAAAIIVMLVIVLVINTGAILLRNRYEKKRT